MFQSHRRPAPLCLLASRRPLCRFPVIQPRNSHDASQEDARRAAGLAQGEAAEAPRHKPAGPPQRWRCACCEWQQPEGGGQRVDQQRPDAQRPQFLQRKWHLLAHPQCKPVVAVADEAVLQIKWASQESSVLQGYRRAYRLDTPSAFKNPLSHVVLSQGIGRLSPTMARPKPKRRVHKDQLALAVRKNFNALAVTESDVIVDWLYKSKHQGTDCEGTACMWRRLTLVQTKNSEFDLRRNGNKTNSIIHTLRCTSWPSSTIPHVRHDSQRPLYTKEHEHKH